MAQERTGIIVGTNSGHVRAFYSVASVIPAVWSYPIEFFSESIRAEGSW